MFVIYLNETTLSVQTAFSLSYAFQSKLLEKKCDAWHDVPAGLANKTVCSVVEMLAFGSQYVIALYSE